MRCALALCLYVVDSTVRTTICSEALPAKPFFILLRLNPSLANRSLPYGGLFCGDCRKRAFQKKFLELPYKEMVDLPYTNVRTRVVRPNRPITTKKAQNPVSSQFGMTDDDRYDGYDAFSLLFALQNCI